MTQALYAHMNNKKIIFLKKIFKSYTIKKKNTQQKVLRGGAGGGGVGGKGGGGVRGEK
jgi:hypothetical protein